MIYCRSAEKKLPGILVAFFLLFLMLLISGCAATSALQSKVLEKPAEPIRSAVLIYVENDLEDKRGRNPIPRDQTSLGKVGYFDIPKLLAERAQPVFSINGLSASKILITDGVSLPTLLEKTAKDFPGSPILVLQMIGVNAFHGAATNLYFRQQVDLYRTQPFGKLWAGLFENVVGFSAVMTIGFDVENVDRILVTILRQLATDGLIVEPTGGVKHPRSGKSG